MEVLFLLYTVVSSVVIVCLHIRVTRLAKIILETAEAVEGNLELIEKIHESNTKLWNAHLEKNHGYVAKE